MSEYPSPREVDEWSALLHKAETEPIGLDLSDYGDEWCAGFLAGQRSILEEIQAARLTPPRPFAPVTRTEPAE